MRHWYLYILATLLTFSVAACSDDAMDVPLSAEGTEVYVSVMLSIGGNEGKTRTRATITAPGDGNPAISLEDGSFQDSYIDPDDVELFVFDSNNQFVDKVSILWRTHSGTTDNVTSPTEEPYQCLIQGYLDMENLTEGNYHIMALCNLNGVLKGNGYTLSVGTSIDEVINNITFSGYNTSFTQTLLGGTDGNYTARIPMWGICTVSLAKGENTTAPIAVLRAMAQVRVRLDDGIKSKYTLNGASLNIANTGGTLAAGNKQAYTYTNNTYTTAWNTNAVTPITSATPYGETTEGTPVEGPLGLPFIKNGDDYIIYVPEYQNLNGGNVVSTPASISLDITDSNGNPILDSEGDPYQLHFADYSNGNVPTAPEWDIIRNDIYEYTITDIKENGGIQANVRVMPWEYEKMGYELSQEATVYIWYTSQAPYNYGYGMALPVAYDWGDTENRDKYILKVQVNVQEPKDVKWVAHLTNTVDFELTETFEYNQWYSETYYKYGYGGEDAKLVAIRAKNPYDGTIKTTELYFTIETLVKGNAIISTGETIKEATNSIPDRIRIVQIE